MGPVQVFQAAAAKVFVIALLAGAACGGRTSLGGASSGSSPGAGGSATPGSPSGAGSDASKEATTVSLPEGGGALEAGAIADAAVRTESAAESGAESGTAPSDAPVVCEPIANATYFVDPITGHDDDPRATGARNCPFQSLSHAFAAVRASSAPATVSIVNASGAPTLSPATGERYPLFVPPGATLMAEDTTRNTPTLAVEPQDDDSSTWELPGCSSPCPTALVLAANARVSHVNLRYAGGPAAGGMVIESGSVDHIGVQGFGNQGILAYSEAPGAGSAPIAIGPGVVVSGSSIGLEVNGVTVEVTGGQGTDHTSFGENTSAGIVVDANGAVSVKGTPIGATAPDTSDVDVDGNKDGVLLAGTAMLVGLHAAGNTGIGIHCNGCSVTVRGSLLADNAVGVVQGQGSVDLGNSVGDYGRNIFVGATQCAIWPSDTMSAVGNIFGTVDCALGGKLSASALCSGNFTLIDVSNCTF